MVLDLYRFDARLRLLVMQAIDMIEVSVRASLAYKLGHELGPFGYIESHQFMPFTPSTGAGCLRGREFDRANFMSKLQQEVNSWNF